MRNYFINAFNMNILVRVLLISTLVMALPPYFPQAELSMQYTLQNSYRDL